MEVLCQVVRRHGVCMLRWKDASNQDAATGFKSYVQRSTQPKAYASSRQMPISGTLPEDSQP